MKLLPGLPFITCYIFYILKNRNASVTSSCTLGAETSRFAPLVAAFYQLPELLSHSQSLRSLMLGSGAFWFVA